jgi:polyhydroxybutyrate depolymerase
MSRSRMTVLAVLMALAAAGCDSAAPPASPTAAPSSAAPDAAAGGPGSQTIQLGDRPFTLHVPSTYQAGTPAPLLVLLHGYTSSGQGQESYLRFVPEAEKRGLLYATPNGTVDARSNRFWNATDACCNLYGATVDDAAYLTDLIKAISTRYTVDTRRVYLAGHSNGAFMSFRMACDHADIITAIAALNGAMWQDLSKCRPSRPVSVLNIRGTADATIVFDGGGIAGHEYPSTETTVADWVGLDGCAKSPDTTAAPLDLDTSLPGAETTVSRYGGCQGGATVELWTMKDGRHIPAVGPAFVPAVLDFLLAQSR